MPLPFIVRRMLGDCKTSVSRMSSSNLLRDVQMKRLDIMLSGSICDR